MSQVFVEAQHEGPSLRPGDLDLLDRLEAYWNPIKRLIQGMTTGLQRGIYLSGPAGIGKTFLVTKILNEIGADYRHHTVRISTPALFMEMMKLPYGIHIVEDIGSLLTSAMN